MQANVTPIGSGVRAVSFDARSVSLRDLLLALRVDCSNLEADGSISATMRAEVAPDGMPEIASGRFMMVNGSLNDPTNPDAHVPIDRAEMTVDWSSAQHALAVPFQLVSGGTRFTLMARAEAPRDSTGPWMLGLSGGSVVLTPADPGDEPVLLNRIMVRGRFDPVAQRLKIDQGEASGKDAGLAMSGMLDFSTPDPRLAIGLASRNMTFAAFKQLWPPFINPPVRQWVMERVSGGVIEQAEIATNAPMSTLRNGGPPVPDDGLSIQIVTSGSTVRPFDDLPEIRDADLVTRIKGRSATVSLGRGTVEMPSGRRLTMANGVFEVPETQGDHPPARVRTRIEGPIAAGVDLLNMDRLKGTMGVQLDPATTRGNILATFNMGLPLGEEIKDGTAHRLFRHRRHRELRGRSLRDVAEGRGADIARLRQQPRLPDPRRHAHRRRAGDRGDAPQRRRFRRRGQAAGDARRRRAHSSRLGHHGKSQRPGDDQGRRKSRSPGGDQENKLAVEADFAQAKVENLLPGWVKPANRPARATFVYAGGKGRPGRFDDIVIDGGGAAIRGNAETDANGELVVANFPVFGMSDGDKVTVRIERTPDNLYKATVRGDVYDGRGFIKTSMAGSGADAKQKKSGIDVDLDAKVDKFVGLKGESLRNVDLHMTKRGGTLRALSLNAKIGNDGTLTGEMRGRPGERQMVVIESSDAGALFRFTDTYSRMIGGQAWIAMDPPNSEGNPQEGLLNVTDFSVKGEAALDRIAAGPPNVPNNGVQFSRMRAGFTRAPGRMTIREGLVSGPMIGASIDGLMDYANNDLHLRGTFVPLHEAPTARSGEIPIVGFFLGGKEGLIGSMTYEVVGSPGAPVLRVNPISMVAPGFVRKFLEFPSNQPGDNRFPEPWQNSRN